MTIKGDSRRVPVLAVYTLGREWCGIGRSRWLQPSRHTGWVRWVLTLAAAVWVSRWSSRWNAVHTKWHQCTGLAHAPFSLFLSRVKRSGCSGRAVLVSNFALFWSAPEYSAIESQTFPLLRCTCSELIVYFRKYSNCGFVILVAAERSTLLYAKSAACRSFRNGFRASQSPERVQSPSLIRRVSLKNLRNSNGRVSNAWYSRKSKSKKLEVMICKLF